MKWIRSRAAVLCLMALLGASASACSPYDLQDLLQEEPENIESESVKDSQNQQKAEAPAADTWQLEKPQREQISVGKYAYEHLDQQGQVIYDEMLTAILNHEEKIRLSTTDLDLMRKAYTAVCGDYGGLFWVEGYVFTRYTKGEELVSLEFAPKYTMSEEERKITQAQIDETVDLWMNGISINDTDYEKAKYVYELLALNTEYVPDATDSQNIISVFIKQQTVCQGYACAVQYLLGQLGIQSVIVSGTALGDAHAWNLICLDGEYYYMDATWGNNGYRNKEGLETSFIDYNYMAMTTAEMMMGHVPDAEIELPECTAVMNNYYIKEGTYIEEWNPEWMGALLTDAWMQGQVVTLRFSDEILKKQAFRYFIEEGYIADYCDGITEVNYIEDNMWKEISFCFN
ncbi:MAG: hypothetical protein HFH50_01810 [Lachnospiraceae bacterium]|jgi:hypothetical protein|nr:hypothetical protein [Lachnospiraceae bacterium]MCI9060306.1 hypothetical protein [Lachnospiraceae bacterium]GFI33159.1 hypothetical protein IMSAGC013_04567 [Lachnospiraceae bacterium]